MSIDWSGEPFARLFKRETDDDLLLSWEARAVWHEFLKRCDRNGRIETKRGVRGFAALIRIPLEVVERVLQELIEDGRIQSEPGRGFVSPNYVTANYTPRSAAARMADVRVRQAGLPSGTSSPHVTARNEASRDVTESDAAFPLQIRADQSTPPRAIPSGWAPRPEERELARQLGLDADDEAREFRSYWLGDGRKKANWDEAFAARLYQQAKRKKTPSPREIPEL